ncbi:MULTISPECIES: hypothetical protein [unclassified Desulfovibrio]|uniref:hypothetical protein n=1 Tax=unclassified Desulfovibrio TaxID=2593640 RepID=UPI0013EC08E9|nr:MULTISPECIES: hypothetical protein [unclassified Desulfovibrio]
MSFPLKRILHVCGTLLAVIAIVFLGLRLRSYLDQIDFSTLLSSLWIYLLLLSFLFSFCNFFLVFIWYRCLEYLDVHPLFSRATWIYGISQIGKYIPGNIFHLAGRQTLGMAESLPGGKILQSIIFELGILACTGAAIFCPPFIVQYFFPSLAPGWLFGIFGMCCITVPYVAGRVLKKAVRSALIWAIFYLCSFGAAFAALLSLLTEAPLSPMELFYASTAYIVAWYVGFVTPGAPAGLGIREGVMLFLMKDIPFPEADLLLAIMLCRIVTILGDFLFFLESVGIRYISAKKDEA